VNEPLRNTLTIVGQVELWTVPLATSLALLLERTDLPLRRLVWGLLVALLFLPLYLQAAAWDAGFGRQGWLQYQSQLASEPWLAGQRAVVWIHACAALPWATLLVAGSLRFVNRQWEELAQLEAGPWRVLASVTLPRALPGIAAATLWVAITTSAEMIVTDMYLVRTYAEAIYLDLAAGATLSELTWGAAGNLTVVASLVIAAAGMSWLLSSPRGGVPRAEPVRWELGRWRWPIGLACLTLVMLLWLVPLFNLLYHAGTEVVVAEEGRVRQWSAVGVLRQIAAAPRQFHEEFWWSGQLGILAAVLSVSGALPLAWWARSSRLAVGLGCGLAALALAIPGPLVALLALTLRDSCDIDWLVRVFDETLLVVAAVHACRAFPLVWLLLLDGLRAFPQEEWEDAAVAGAAPLRRWLTIVLPRRRGAILAAGLLALGISLAEVPVSLLVGPQGTTTLSVRTFQLVHYGSDDRLAGLALFTTGLTCLLAAATVWLAGWGARNEQFVAAGDV